MVKYTLKEKVLKFLMENKKVSHSIASISKELKADYKNTSQALGKLDSEVYSKVKHGNSYLIGFSQKNSMEILSVEEKRREEFLLKNPEMKAVKKYIKELNYPFMILLIFGSYSKKTKTKNSDIDVCVILDDKSKSSKLHEKLDLLSLNLEIQEFTTEEFISMIKNKQNNLGNEIIKSNIILYGKENYYNLISKWTKKE